jgi:uncharacterized protein YqjF (DUF2071 family)
VSPLRAPSVEARLAPGRRPRGLPAGFQEWRRLLFLHWAVPTEIVRPLVPRRLAIDVHDGLAYVGIVPFFVQAARPFGAPRALGLEFLETNVRTYVHLDGRAPGVYFFSLDAASLLAVFGARVAFGLPYFYAYGREQRSGGGDVEYTLRRFAGAQPMVHVRYTVGEPVGPAPPGTLEHFLIERYLLHVQRGPTLWTVQVHHRPYPLHRARLLERQDELVGAAGIALPDLPPLVHSATGVDVEVFPPRLTPLIDHWT